MSVFKCLLKSYRLLAHIVLNCALNFFIKHVWISNIYITYIHSFGYILYRLLILQCTGNWLWTKIKKVNHDSIIKRSNACPLIIPLLSLMTLFNTKMAQFFWLTCLNKRFKWAFLFTICPLSIIVVIDVFNFSHLLN